MRRAVTCLALFVATAAGAELPPPGDCAGTYWDLTALFEAGDRVYGRVLLTRNGPGDLVAAGQGHWMAPDGTRTPFQNGRRAGRFSVDAAGSRLRIGSTELDLAAATHRFQVDNDKRGVKVRVQLSASDAVDALVQVGELAVAVVHLGSPAEARVWRAGMAAPRELRGRATLVRTTHATCERDLADLRLDVHRLADAGVLLLIHERLAGGGQRTWLGWRAGKRLVTLRPERVALEHWRGSDSGSALPARLRIESPVRAGTVSFDAPHLAVDPLDALPRIVRMMYWFGASPRRVWVDANADLEGEAGARVPPPRGPALASFTFLRQPPPTLPPEPGR